MAGHVHIGGAGLVSLTLSPPLSFIQDQFGAFRHELENLEPLWARFAPLLGEMETQRFESAGFGEWPGLADSTLKEKTRLGYPLDPLVRTGDLKASLTDPGRAAEMTPNTLRYGTDVPYATFHQEGTARMPQRKPLDINLTQRRQLEAEMVAWIDEAAARVFHSAA